MANVETQLVSTSVLLQDERSGVLGTGTWSPYITEDDRTILVEWLVEVSTNLGLKSQTLLKSVIVLDAALARMPNLTTENLQLVGIASLALAALYEQEFPTYMEEYVAITASRESILEMQETIFKLLGCSLSVPTEMDFLRILCIDYPDALPQCEQLAIALCVRGSDYLPSVRATACIDVVQQSYTNVFDIPHDVVLDAPRDKEEWIASTFFKPSLEITLISPEAVPEDAPLLGKGASGIVRKVDYGGATFAVKTTAPDLLDDLMDKSTIREISILLSLSHPNVVKIHHITSDLRSIFIELGQGDLEGLIHEVGPWDYNEQRHGAHQLLDALVYIHSCGVLHRDIKPQNIIVYVEQEVVYKIADFGSARGCNTPVDNGQYTDVLGTLWYAAPEMLLEDDRYSDRIDVWSMLCTLYQCATGSVLFRGKDQEDQLDTIDYVLDTVVFENNDMLSPFYKEMMTMGLVVDPVDRPSARDLL